MRLLFIFAILLAFPITELWILVQLGDEYGWWVLVYVLLILPGFISDLLAVILLLLPGA